MNFRNAEELYDFYNGSDIDLGVVIDDFYFSDKIYRASFGEKMITDQPVSREHFVAEFNNEVLGVVSLLIGSWLRGFITAVEKMSALGLDTEEIQNTAPTPPVILNRIVN